ncbi:MAG: DUF4299 family protein [Acetatifactor sp.]|nr:DUF4299 family protein [Acetatifactor sp.]
MSINVTIKNGKLIKKPLELQDLTLGKYACGSLDEYGRNTGEIKDGDIVIYDPKAIGRGITVRAWSANVTEEIWLMANNLATGRDMELFYEVIKNVMHVWKAKSFEQEDAVYSEADIDRLCSEQRRFALKYMAGLDRMTQNSKSDYVTIYCAMLPIDVDVRLLQKFGMEEDEEGLKKYLHELQSKDVYYAVPYIYRCKQKENAFFGNFTVTSETDTIFPRVAKTPFGFRNPATGKNLECDFFTVSLFSLKQDRAVGRMSFEDFVRLAGIEDCQPFDKTHVILKGLSEEKMAELANSEHKDPLAD